MNFKSCLLPVQVTMFPMYFIMITTGLTGTLSNVCSIFRKQIIRGISLSNYK